MFKPEVGRICFSKKGLPKNNKIAADLPFQDGNPTSLCRNVWHTLIIRYFIVTKSKINLNMKPLGGLLIFFGISALIFSMQMDTSVEVKYPGGSSFGMPERVNNIGLMNEKQNRLMLSGILLIGGIILFADSVDDRRADGNYVIVKHHVGQPPVTFPGLISCVEDYCLLFPIKEPVALRNDTVVIVRQSFSCRP